MNDFLPNFPYEIIIANAFYAKQTDFIDYEELARFRTVLYQTVTKTYPYVMFNEPKSFWPYPERVEEHLYEIKGKTFLKENTGVIFCTGGELTKEWIDKVNYYYPDDIKEFFVEAREKYIEKGSKKKIKKKSR